MNDMPSPPRRWIPILWIAIGILGLIGGLWLNAWRAGPRFQAKADHVYAFSSSGKTVVLKMGRNGPIIAWPIPFEARLYPVPTFEAITPATSYESFSGRLDRDLGSSTFRLGNVELAWSPADDQSCWIVPPPLEGAVTDRSGVDLDVFVYGTRRLSPDEFLGVVQANDLEAAALQLKVNPSLVAEHYGPNATFLHLAVGQNRREMAELLLKHGADVNAQEATKVTPLMLAAGSGYVILVRLLLEHGADPNLGNAEGLRPLHLVADKGYTAVAELLLAAKADPNAKANAGYTALDIAQGQGMTEIADLLKKYGAGK